MNIVLVVLSNLGLILKFWDKIEALLMTLKDTPEEHHAKIMAATVAEADRLKKQGRPSW